MIGPDAPDDGPIVAVPQVAAELGRGERDLIATLDRNALAEQRELVDDVGNIEK